MIHFQWAMVVVGMILSISVTRVLSAMAAAFRSRFIAKPDWIPLVWATCIFLLQLELWWGLADLRQIINEWTFPLFMLFICSPLLLFFASALILPFSELRENESQYDIFVKHGHWALIPISAYFFESLLETIYFWKGSIWSLWGTINTVLIFLPIIAFLSSRRIHGVIAVLTLILTIWFLICDISIPIPAKEVARLMPQ